MQKLRDWLTPVRRKAIYAIGVAVGTFLVAVGIVTPDMISKSLDAVGIVTAAVLTLTNLLAAINTNTSD